MTQFSLTSWTAAKAKHINKREENHGDELVDAMDIHYRIEFTNDHLDDWFPGLRKAIYIAKDSLTIEGVPEITPDKRTDLIESPLNLKTELAGYMLYMRRGAGHSAPMKVELAGADAKDFKLDPKAGGICTLEFKVRVSSLDAETMGKLASMGGREVEIMFVPPKLQEGTLPDGHQPKGKAKTVSAKQMRLDGSPVAPAVEPEGVNPFKLSVVDGKIVDNNPTPSDAGDATTLFLSEHAAPEVPDEPEDEDPFAPIHRDDDAADTGLATELRTAAPARSIAKKVAIAARTKGRGPK